MELPNYDLVFRNAHSETVILSLFYYLVSHWSTTTMFMSVVPALYELFAYSRLKSQPPMIFTENTQKMCTFTLTTPNMT